MRPLIIKTTNVLSGRIKVDRMEVLMPDGALVERHVEDHGDGVAVLPYDPERRVALLVSQPRPAVMLGQNENILELIAGRLDGIDPVDRVRKEAIEEAGVRLGPLENVVHLWSIPSVSTERLHVYLSNYCRADRIGDGGGHEDEHENITVHEVSLADLAIAVTSGRIQDAKTLIAVQALQIRRPELFARAVSAVADPIIQEDEI